MYFSLKNRLDQPLLSTDFNQPDLNKTNMDKESNDGITSSHLYYVFFLGGGHGLYIVRLTSWGWHSDNLSGFLWHSGSGCMVLHTTQMKQMLKSAMAQDSVKHQNNKQKRAGRKDEWINPSRKGGSQQWTLSKSKENRTLLDITGSYSLGQVAPYPPSSGLRFSLPRVRKAA